MHYCCSSKSEIHNEVYFPYYTYKTLMETVVHFYIKTCVLNTSFSRNCESFAAGSNICGKVLFQLTDLKIRKRMSSHPQVLTQHSTNPLPATLHLAFSSSPSDSPHLIDSIALPPAESCVGSRKTERGEAGSCVPRKWRGGHCLWNSTQRRQFHA